MSTRAFPDGSSLEFVETDTFRGYYLVPEVGKKTRLPSVTTILGVLNKPALMRWSEAEGIKGAVNAHRMGELDDLEPDECVERVRGLELGADAARNKAASRGLDIHSILETFATTGELPNPTDFPAEHGGYIQGLARVLLKLDPEPIHVEQLVCHREDLYAGRYDLLAMVDGKRTRLDLKTSAGGRAYPEAHIQLVAYDLAAVDCGEQPAEAMLTVAVGKDGSFEVADCVATPAHWRSVLSTYRALAEVRRPIDARHRAERKAAKLKAEMAAA